MWYQQGAVAIQGTSPRQAGWAIVGHGGFQLWVGDTAAVVGEPRHKAKAEVIADRPREYPRASS